MPGSLNYSPSGSEGGRSLGGGADLEKSLIGVDLTTTPGTTPLKWRKSSSSGSSGGRSVSAVEDCSMPAATKAPAQGQDGVPPRIATRKPSWDPTKVPGTAAETIGNHSQPTNVSSAFSANTTNGTEKASSEQGNVTSSSASAALADRRETGETVNFSENLGHAVRNMPRRDSSQDGCPSSRRAAAAAEEVAAALAKGAVAHHGQDVGPDSCQEEQEGQPDKCNHTGNAAKPTALVEQRESPQPSAESTTATAIRGADEAVSIKAPTEMALGVLVNIDHEHALQPHVDRSIEDASPVFEGDRVFACDGRRSDDCDHNHNNNNNNKTSISILDGGSPSTATAPMKSGERRSTRADSEDSRMQQAPDTSSAMGGEKIQTETNHKPSSEIQTGPRTQEEKFRSDGENAESTHGDVARDSENASQNRKADAGSRRRSSGRKNVAGVERTQAQGAGWRETRSELDPHARPVDPERNSEGGGVVESVSESVVERNMQPAASARQDQDLLQSPPMLSRRTIGRGSQSLMGLNNAAVNSSGGWERVDGDAEVDNLRLDYPEIGEQSSSALRPPPLTPRRERPKRTSAMEERASPVVPPSPRSPIAVAARVISQEESVRSTLRMKRAAEAIAREDAQMIAATERREQRRKSSGHRATVPAPFEHEYDDVNGDVHEEDEEEEARARHDEKMRIRALRAMEARAEADVERDRALELTLEVLRRRQADKRRGMGRAQSAPGRKRMHPPPRRSRRPHGHRATLARSVKDSAARSCGLSPAQVILLQRSRQLGGDSDRSKARSERRREELAEPKEERPATRIRHPATEALVDRLTKRMTDKEKRAFLHACLEDARECTHRPRTRSAAARNGRGAEGSGDREGDEEAKGEQGAATKRDVFLYRVHAQERAKTAAMEHRRGELAYKAVLDKRACPGCGAEQSYDEVLEKRKTCPNCEVEYRKPKTWAGVRKDFLKRVEEFQQSKWQALQSTSEFQDTQMMRMLAPGRRQYSRKGALESESEMEERQRLFWEDIEEDFVARLQEDAARRQASLKSRSSALYQDWTFQPTLSPASQRVVGDSTWAGMTFLERMEGDLQRRRESAPGQQYGYNQNFGDNYVLDG